jgi:hypothetical protein
MDGIGPSSAWYTLGRGGSAGFAGSGFAASALAAGFAGGGAVTVFFGPDAQPKVPRRTPIEMRREKVMFPHTMVDRLAAVPASRLRYRLGSMKKASA